MTDSAETLPEPLAEPLPEPLGVPVLTGEVVTLRPHTEGDLDAVYERCIDPVTQQFTTIPLEYTREMAQEYLAGLLEPSAARISWAIEVDERYAGTIDLRAMAVDDGAGDLGYVTHPAFRGRGVMSDAVRLVVAHAFDTLGWQLVRWQAHTGNWASLKAVWRAGFPTPTFVPYLLVERPDRRRLDQHDRCGRHAGAGRPVGAGAGRAVGTASRLKCARRCPHRPSR